MFRRRLPSTRVLDLEQRDLIAAALREAEMNGFFRGVDAGAQAIASVLPDGPAREAARGLCGGHAQLPSWNATESIRALRDQLRTRDADWDEPPLFAEDPRPSECRSDAIGHSHDHLRRQAQIFYERRISAP